MNQALKYNPLVINILCVTYFCDVINNARPAKYRYASHAVNGVSAQRIMYTFLQFPYFLLFLFFHYNFMIYIDFTHIAASNIATDNVTNWVIHRVFNTNI